MLTARERFSTEEESFLLLWKVFCHRTRTVPDCQGRRVIRPRRFPSGPAAAFAHASCLCEDRRCVWDFGEFYSVENVENEVM